MGGKFGGLIDPKNPWTAGCRQDRDIPGLQNLRPLAAAAKRAKTVSAIRDAPALDPFREQLNPRSTPPSRRTGLSSPRRHQNKVDPRTKPLFSILPEEPKDPNANGRNHHWPRLF